MTSKAWPYEEARKLLKRWPEGKGEPVIFETGYGPSGLPHIGTFNEVLRTTMVRHAYEELTGGAATRILIASPCHPTSSVRLARGCTCTRRDATGTRSWTAEDLPLRLIGGAATSSTRPAAGSTRPAA